MDKWRKPAVSLHKPCNSTAQIRAHFLDCCFRIVAPRLVRCSSTFLCYILFHKSFFWVAWGTANKELKNVAEAALVKLYAGKPNEKLLKAYLAFIASS